MTIVKNIFKDIVLIIALFSIIIGIIFISDTINAKETPYKNVVQQENLKDNEQVEISFVSSTEYTSKDSNGSTIVKLRDSHNNFVNTTCWETILYPNRTIYLQTTEMNQDLGFGEYWINFEISDTTGVYSQEVMCLYKNKNISSAKAFHISALGDRILNSTNNIRNSINTILNALNCSQNEYNNTCILLQEINKSVWNMTSVTQNTFLDINTSLNYIFESIVNINGTIKLYYEIAAPNCVVGSYWRFSANVTNEESESLPYLNCILSTNLFGNQQVNYSKTMKTYYIQNLCLTPQQTVNWDFNCVRT